MKPFCPQSFLVNAAAVKTVSRMSPEDCKRWVTEIYRNYESFLADADYVPMFSDDLIGDQVQQTWFAQQHGLLAQRASHFGNPSGKPKDKTEPPPRVTPSQPPGVPPANPNQSSIQPESNSYNTSIIQPAERQELLKKGYTDSEINEALGRIDGRSTITNIVHYVSKVIDNARKDQPKKTVSAQQYGQRPYDNEDEEAMRRMIEEYDSDENIRGGG